MHGWLNLEKRGGDAYLYGARVGFLTDAEALRVALEFVGLLKTESLQKLSQECSLKLLVDAMAEPREQQGACSCKSGCFCELHSRENGREP